MFLKNNTLGFLVRLEFDICCDGKICIGWTVVPINERFLSIPSKGFISSSCKFLASLTTHWNDLNVLLSNYKKKNQNNSIFIIFQFLFYFKFSFMYYLGNWNIRRNQRWKNFNISFQWAINRFVIIFQIISRFWTQISQTCDGQSLHLTIKIIMSW